MADLVVLDSSPLGLACNNPRRPPAAYCLNWLDGLVAAGKIVYVPEIADFEVRRELIRIGALRSIARLDSLLIRRALNYAPITTAQMRQAAIFWADARNRGFPTASPDSLDADVILAGCAATIGRPGDQIVVATANIGHLARYCDARLWTSIS
jgi:hypothetical protein